MAYRLAHYFCLMSQAPCHLSNQKRDRYRMFPWTYYKSFSFSRLLPFFLIKKLSHCPPYFCPYPRWFHSGEVIVQEITASWIKGALMQGQAGCLCIRIDTASNPGIANEGLYEIKMSFLSFLRLGLSCFPASVPRKRRLFSWVLACYRALRVCGLGGASHL